MSADWKQRPEGGGRFALWLFRNLARVGGRTLGRALLYPTTLYFLMVRAPERRESHAYLARVLPSPPRLLDVARHIHTFAATILDRFFMLTGQMQRFDIALRGMDELHGALDQGRGVMVFGSHLGSFDALRALSRERPDVQVRVLLDKAHNPAIAELLDALNPALAAGIIDAGQDGPSIVLAIKQATDEGALVALLVDRARPGEPSLDAPFLGGTAAFPTAPWLIAAVLKVPVVLAFGLYRGGNRYELVFEGFSDGVEMPRAQRAAILATLITGYAARLEHHTRSAPYNWFNFFPFWNADAEDSLPVANAAAAGGHRDGACVVEGKSIIGRSEIEALIPHKGSMCLWDEVLDWDAASVRLRAFNHRDAAHPLRSHERLRAVHLCEYGAQAMAVHGGLRASKSGSAAQPGMLVALRNVELHVARIDDLAGAIECHAQVLIEGEGSQQYAFRIMHGQALLAEGRAAVMLQVPVVGPTSDSAQVIGINRGMG